MWFLFAIGALCCWGINAVIESMLASKYGKNPLVLVWFVGLFRIVPICLFPLFFDVRTPWAPAIAGCGVFFFLSSVTGYFMLRKLDASVYVTMQALQSVLLAGVGILFFQESLTPLQICGALLVLFSVTLLSHWRKYRSVFWTLGILLLVACLATPIEIVSKAALNAEQAFVAVFFWSFFGKTVCLSLFPLLVPSFYRDVRVLWKSVGGSFYAAECFILLFSLAAASSSLMAYKLGTLSGVGITYSTSPFFVMAFAWLMLKLLPVFAPKELLTKESVTKKLTGFLGVCAGLTLLVVG